MPRQLPALEWTELDDRAVDTARALAMDAVQKVGNGHPGTAMSLAPVAYLLFQKVMRHDPADTHWISRDRFVLSAGHSSLTLYNQLFLGGFGLEIEDIKALRTWDSKTPGHPEYHWTAGVETTTGPLGQGIANAVGMSMASRFLHGLLDPDAPFGDSFLDHDIYCIASDGDLQEGISSEASSIAGHQQLGNLTVIYDDNKISIEDDTDVAFTEDVAKRYEAYGWHVQTVDWAGDRSGQANYHEDIPALYDAIVAARQVTDKPSLIVLKTIIAWPAPTLQGTGKSHGSALGADEIAATKELMGFNPKKDFEVAASVLKHTRKLAQRGKAAGKEWDKAYKSWAKTYPENAALLHRLNARQLPDGWDADLPIWEADPKGVATRKASSKAINAIAPHLPELWGGSADLAESNNTTIEGGGSFNPAEFSTKMWQASPYGRILHFGIREHAMGAILNGITLHGGTRVFGGTFLQFSDYMRPSVRLAALMGIDPIYVWTHDSIGLGEDGPTHQPIEHLAALRAIPNLSVVRPADANETSAAWRATIEHRDGPVGLCLSRQDLPVFGHGEGFATAAKQRTGVAKGGYVLVDSDGDLDVILMATGSEVQLAVEARTLLAKDGIGARVVSLPCLEWFDAQTKRYRDSVLPPSVRARVSVEAGIAQGWRERVGDAGRIVSIEKYGASADYKTIYAKYGVTAKAVAKAAKESIAAAGQ